MEWNLGGASDDSAANAFNDGNPWTSPVLAASSSSSSNVNADFGPGFNDQVNTKNRLPANPLYQGSPELGSFPGKESSSQPKPNNGILNPEATRPTLFRLTSNGLLNGFDSLALSNASQESLSTDDTGPNGTRRSLTNFVALA